jgi:predicted RNase H-like nuclease (RuvC/YqgF family)
VGDNEKQLAVHGERIKQQEQDIKHLYSLVEGLPQRMENMETRFTELCVTLREFMQKQEKQEDKYQTKELCALHEELARKEQEALANKVDNLERKFDKVLWAGLSGAGFVAWEVIKYIPKIFGF